MRSLFFFHRTSIGPVLDPVLHSFFPFLFLRYFSFILRAGHCVGNPRVELSPALSIPLKCKTALLPTVTEWQLWEKIKGKETRVDYASQTVTTREERWQAKIKEYPEAAKFKDRGLRNLPVMEILFKDTVASSHIKFAPSGDPEQGTKATDGIDSPMTEERDVEELIVQGEEIPSSFIQRQKRKRGGKNNKRGVGSRMCDHFDCIIGSLKSENIVTSYVIANVPAIADYLEMLKQLSGMEYGSEIRVLGIRLMKSKSNRETFVLLDDPILKLTWIKSHNLANLSRVDLSFTLQL